MVEDRCSIFAIYDNACRYQQHLAVPLRVRYRLCPRRAPVCLHRQAPGLGR